MSGMTSVSSGTAGMVPNYTSAGGDTETTAAQQPQLLAAGSSKKSIDIGTDDLVRQGFSKNGVNDPNDWLDGNKRNLFVETKALFKSQFYEGRPLCGAGGKLQETVTLTNTQADGARFIDTLEAMPTLHNGLGYGSETPPDTQAMVKYVLNKGVGPEFIKGALARTQALATQKAQNAKGTEGLQVLNGITTVLQAFAPFGAKGMIRNQTLAARPVLVETPNRPTLPETTPVPGKNNITPFERRANGDGNTSGSGGRSSSQGSDGGSRGSGGKPSGGGMATLAPAAIQASAGVTVMDTPALQHAVSALKTGGANANTTLSNGTTITLQPGGQAVRIAVPGKPVQVLPIVRQTNGTWHISPAQTSPAQTSPAQTSGRTTTGDGKTTTPKAARVLNNADIAAAKPHSTLVRDIAYLAGRPDLNFMSMGGEYSLPLPSGATARMHILGDGLVKATLNFSPPVSYTFKVKSNGNVGVDPGQLPANIAKLVKSTTTQQSPVVKPQAKPQTRQPVPAVAPLPTVATKPKPVPAVSPLPRLRAATTPLKPDTKPALKPPRTTPATPATSPGGGALPTLKPAGTPAGAGQALSKMQRTLAQIPKDQMELLKRADSHDPVKGLEMGRRAAAVASGQMTRDQALSGYTGADRAKMEAMLGSGMFAGARGSGRGTYPTSYVNQLWDEVDKHGATNLTESDVRSMRGITESALKNTDLSADDKTRFAQGLKALSKAQSSYHNGRKKLDEVLPQIAPLVTPETAKNMMPAELDVLQTALAKALKANDPSTGNNPLTPEQKTQYSKALKVIREELKVPKEIARWMIQQHFASQISELTEQRKYQFAFLLTELLPPAARESESNLAKALDRLSPSTVKYAINEARRQEFDGDYIDIVQLTGSGSDIIEFATPTSRMRSTSQLMDLCDIVDNIGIFSLSHKDISNALTITRNGLANSDLTPANQIRLSNTVKMLTAQHEKQNQAREKYSQYLPFIKQPTKILPITSETTTQYPGGATVQGIDSINRGVDAQMNANVPSSKNRNARLRYNAILAKPGALSASDVNALWNAAGQFGIDKLSEAELLNLSRLTASAFRSGGKTKTDQAVVGQRQQSILSALQAVRTSNGNTGLATSLAPATQAGVARPTTDETPAETDVDIRKREDNTIEQRRITLMLKRIVTHKSYSKSDVAAVWNEVDAYGVGKLSIPNVRAMIRTTTRVLERQDLTPAERARYSTGLADLNTENDRQQTIMGPTRVAASATIHQYPVTNRAETRADIEKRDGNTFEQRRITRLTAAMLKNKSYPISQVKAVWDEVDVYGVGNLSSQNVNRMINTTNRALQVADLSATDRSRLETGLKELTKEHDRQQILLRRTPR